MLELPARPPISRLIDAVSRAIHAGDADDRVHFHAGDHGRPYVCENPRCEGPALGSARS
jgi:hypothetical protein